jgi:ATP-dependent helicase/nuclease subunit B
MTAIADADERGGLEQAWRRVLEASAAHAARLQAHPSRTVILLPFVQLLPTAREQAVKNALFQGFVPRFETVQSWARRLDAFTPGELDLSFDMALDSLRARAWLERAGLADKRALLTGSLVEAAHQLAGVAASLPSEERPAWAQGARASLMAGLESFSGVLGYEQAIGRIALEWAAASGYVTDVLWGDALRTDVDAIVQVPGLGRDALAEGLCARHAAISTVVTDWLPSSTQTKGTLSALELPRELDEADAATACVIEHVNAGQAPGAPLRRVAVAAVDRMLTRQVSSQLVQQGLAVNDETGWRLATTRAAAMLMSLLRAARWDATQAERIDWLRHTNTPRAQVDALETQWRRGGATTPDFTQNQEQNRPSAHMESASPAIKFIVNGVESDWSELLNGLRRARPVSQWLADLKAALQATGQWAALQADEAGRVVMQALHLDSALVGEMPALEDHAATTLSLSEFSRWAQDALEADSYKPSLGTDLQEAQVTILPLAQLLARPFDVVVIAGADEERLPNAPEPTGLWTASQRVALGLPTREQMTAEWRRAWELALQMPQVELIWPRSDGERERLMSPLLARHLMETGIALADIRRPDPREAVAVRVEPTHAPDPVAEPALLPRTARVTQSDYQALRTCPYRYYALRLLGLSELDELDADIGKRDFGSWIHDVLRRFHEARQASSHRAPDAVADATADAQLLDDIAAEERLPGDGFIPFDAAWPQLREGYLAWLAKHEAQGVVFSAAEQKLVRPIDETTRLEGRVDRIDTSADGLMVIDYKTESLDATRRRVKQPLEDTQLAFYAALHDDASSQGLQAAYLNIGEKATALVTQGDVQAAREALIDGVRVDIARVRAGEPLRALGEGGACEYCAARGLCRKDFWA